MSDRIDRILDLLDVGLQATSDSGFWPDDGRLNDYDVSATDMLAEPDVVIVSGVARFTFEDGQPVRREVFEVVELTDEQAEAWRRAADGIVGACVALAIVAVEAITEPFQQLAAALRAAFTPGEEASCPTPMTSRGGRSSRLTPTPGSATANANCGTPPAISAGPATSPGNGEPPASTPSSGSSAT